MLSFNHWLRSDPDETDLDTIALSCDHSYLSPLYMYTIVVIFGK